MEISRDALREEAIDEYREDVNFWAAEATRANANNREELAVAFSAHSALAKRNHGMVMHFQEVEPDAEELSSTVWTRFLVHSAEYIGSTMDLIEHASQEGWDVGPYFDSFPHMSKN